MTHTTASAFILLLLVLDPFGTLPVFLSVLSGVAPKRRPWVALREAIIAFLVLLGFMLGGDAFLRVMRLSERSLEVAGGVILLLVSIKIIFSSGRQLFGGDSVVAAQQESAASRHREPFVFPIAVPLLAGPSAMATVLLLASRQPAQMWDWILALSGAVGVCALVLLASEPLHRWLGDSVVQAIEKLMGLVLCAIAVEMILAGMKHYFAGN
jgi:MarC family membrane protein